MCRKPSFSRSFLTFWTVVLSVVAAGLASAKPPDRTACSSLLASRFRDPALESFILDGEGGNRFPWSRYQHVVAREIERVLSATSLAEVRARCGGIKHYKGGARYAGWFAVEADKQWRILFRWEEGRAIQIFVSDYHND